MMQQWSTQGVHFPGGTFRVSCALVRTIRYLDYYKLRVIIDGSQLIECILGKICNYEMEYISN